MLNVDRRIEISVRTVATDHAAKRLLVGPVGPIYIMAHTALLWVDLPLRSSESSGAVAPLDNSMTIAH